MITGVGVGVGAIALAVAAFMLWKNKAPKVVAALVLLGSASISGGVFGNVQHRLTDWIDQFSSTASAQVFGVAVPAMIAVFGVLWFVHDMWPKNKASRATSVVAFVTPALAASIPGAAGTLVLSALGLLTTLTGAGVQAIFGG